MKPAAGYYKGKEQTYLKHFFLDRYLETVAFHIGYSYREFVYVDCFSGPWKAADEQLADTSIRIALSKLNDVRDALAKQGRRSNVSAIFVEKDPKAFRHLETALSQYSGAIKTTALPGAFEDNISEILKLVGPRFAFFFIDPKGWTGLPMESIAPILRHQPGEVMINFMYDFVNRFINFPEPSNELSLDRFFGTRTWREIRNAPHRESASVDCYQERLRLTGSYKFVTSTNILKPQSDRSYFHLVYATRNPKGIIKFREVERQTVMEQDLIRDTAQREYREARTGQAEIHFPPTSDISSFIQEERSRRLQQARKLLFSILREGSMLYEDLQPRILELPLVWNTDFNKMLMAEHKTGRLCIEVLAPTQRVPRAGNTIRLTDESKPKIEFLR